MALYYVTNLGANIRLAQYIYAGIYLLNLLVVFDIYRQVKKVSTMVSDIDVCFIGNSFHHRNVILTRLSGLEIERTDNSAI